MTFLTEKIDALPEPIEFLRRIKNITKAAEEVALSDEYDNAELFHNGEESAEYFHYEDGSGGEYTVVSTSAGIIVWGYDHESDHNAYANDTPADQQEALQNVPHEFLWVLTEKTFDWTGSEHPHVYATIAFWSTDEKNWEYSPKLKEYDENDDGGFKYFFKHVINYSSEKYVAYVRNKGQDITEKGAERIRNIFETP